MNGHVFRLTAFIIAFIAFENVDLVLTSDCLFHPFVIIIVVVFSFRRGFIPLPYFRLLVQMLPDHVHGQEHAVGIGLGAIVALLPVLELAQMTSF